MKYINIKNNKYPLSISAIRDMVLPVILPVKPSDDALLKVGYAAVKEHQKPSFDALVEEVIEVSPKKNNGQWQQTWQIVPLSADAKEQKLSDAKEQKIMAMNKMAESLIVAGFESDALGTTHVYQSERDDQLNLVGLVAASGDRSVECSDDNGLTWAYKIHTQAQRQQVLDAGADDKHDVLKKAKSLKKQTDLANTPGELNLVNW